MNKPATYYLLFSILALLMLTVIAITLGNGLHYPQYYDDYNLLVTYQNHGIIGGTLYLFNNVNGRLVSHFISLCIVPGIASSHWLVAGFYLINLLLFILSLAFFLKTFFACQYQAHLTNWQLLFTSGSLYTLFFIFFFAKRFEFWYFISAVFIYQYSIMLMLILNALLLKQHASKTACICILLISACLGFMSENNALAQLLILSFLLAPAILKYHKLSVQHKWHLASAVLITLALTINYLSPGAQHKIMISKTQFSGAGNYISGLSVFISDLLHNWDHITVGGLHLCQLNSLFVQAPCAAFLVLCVRFLARSWLPAKVIFTPGNSIITVSYAALSILIITYLAPAVLYAHILDSILDRCKFIGCFVMFLALFDVAVLATQFSKTPKA